MSNANITLHRGPTLGDFRFRDIAAGPLCLLMLVLNVAEMCWLLKSRKRSRLSNYHLILFFMACMDALVGVFGLVQFVIALTGVWDDHLAATTPVECVILINICSSNSIVVVLGIDRMMAVVSPLRHVTGSSTRRRVVVMSTVAVVVSHAVGIAVFLINKSGSTIDGARVVLVPYLSIHLLAIIVIYAIILNSYARNTQRRRETLSTSASQKSSRFRKADRAILRASFAVVGSFIVCYLPAIIILCLPSRKDKTLVSVVNFLTYLASLVNPCVYFLPRVTCGTRCAKSIDVVSVDSEKSADKR